MEFAVIFIVLGLVIFVGSILGFVANSRVAELQKKILILSRRVDELSRGEAPSPKALPIKTVTTTPADKVVAQAPEQKPVWDRAEPAKAAALEAQPAKRVEPTRPKPSKKPKKPGRSWEEELGARWTVWVGGIALLFGAVFLLRYSIESGFFTPAMRVGMAAVLGLVSLAGGEWLRRQDGHIAGASKLSDKFTKEQVFENSYIPGILSAVGIFSLLGTIFASYELYHFIGPILAFILMGLVSLLALGLGLLHGPWISALGLVASFATPLLIQTDTPNIYGLFGYLTIISLAAWALARFRKWGWLDLATLAGGLFWLTMSVEATKNPSHFMAWLCFLALGLIAGTYIAGRADLVSIDPTMPKPSKTKIDVFAARHDKITATFWSLYASGILLAALDFSSLSFSVEISIAIVFIISLIGTALYAPRFIGNICAAALFAVFLLPFVSWDDAPSKVTQLALSVVIAALIGTGLYVALTRIKNTEISKFYMYVAGIFGAFAPTIIIGIHDLTRLSENIHLKALAFFVCAALYVLACFLFKRRNPAREIVPTIYLLGAAFAYWLGVIIWGKGLDETIGLIMGVVIFALAYSRFKWPALRWISLGFAGIAAAQILGIEIRLTDQVSEQAIFNQLWIYFALPAVICFGAARGFEFSKRDLASEGLKAFGLAFAALFVVFQIRHLLNDGQILASQFSFEEVSLQVAAGLCFTLGGAWLNISGIETPIKGMKTPLHQDLIPGIMTAVSYFTLAVFAAGLCFVLAPLLNAGTSVKGGPVFNSLILAYLVPGILMAGVLYKAQGKRPKIYTRILAGLISLAAVFYVTSQIRVLYSGEIISVFKDFPEGFESYTITASWLVIGIGLLVVGLKRDYKSIRVASAVMIMLATLKAFLVDMATLEGVLRAVSFVVLGLVLIVIGRVYQKILFGSASKADDLLEST